MDVTLSEMEYLALIKSVHTRDVACIAHNILRLEKVLQKMRRILDSHEGLSIMAPQTSNQPLEALNVCICIL